MGTTQKLDFCLETTEKCLKDLRVLEERAHVLIKFAQDYYNDAVHYKEKNDFDTALEAAAYAHGFIDSAVLLGLVEIPDYHLKKQSERKD